MISIMKCDNLQIINYLFVPPAVEVGGGPEASVLSLSGFWDRT